MKLFITTILALSLTISDNLFAKGTDLSEGDSFSDDLFCIFTQLQITQTSPILDCPFDPAQNTPGTFSIANPGTGISYSWSVPNGVQIIGSSFGTEIQVLTDLNNISFTITSVCFFNPNLSTTSNISTSVNRQIESNCCITENEFVVEQISPIIVCRDQSKPTVPGTFRITNPEPNVTYTWGSLSPSSHQIVGSNTGTEVQIRTTGDTDLYLRITATCNFDSEVTMFRGFPFTAALNFDPDCEPTCIDEVIVSKLPQYCANRQGEPGIFEIECPEPDVTYTWENRRDPTMGRIIGNNVGTSVEVEVFTPWIWLHVTGSNGYSKEHHFSLGKGDMTDEGCNYAISWTDKFRATENGDRIINTNTSSGWKSSAASTNRIPSGTEGYIEFYVTHNNTNRMIGLSESNYFDGTWRNHWETIQYNLYLKANGDLSVYENGQYRGSAGQYWVGSRIRIIKREYPQFSQIDFVVHGISKFRLNGPTGSSLSLIADFCLYSPNDYFEGVTMSHEAPGSGGGRIGFDSSTTSRLNLDAEPNLLDSANLVNNNFLNISPVPAKQNVNLKFKNDKSELATILIYSTGGRLIKSVEWSLLPGKNQKVIDTGDLDKGVYFLNLVTSSKKEFGRIVID
ncbi:MAG: T9SS type A sorting domain-containing protein [Bacteroidota bacterium]